MLALTFDGPFVNAGGSALQSALYWSGALVMFTVTEQEEGPAATCRFATVTEVPPLAAVVAAAAFAHVPPMLAAGATRNPLGSVSTNVTSWDGAPVKFVTVNVSVLDAPGAIVVGLKTFCRIVVSARAGPLSSSALASNARKTRRAIARDPGFDVVTLGRCMEGPQGKRVKVME